jgi:hypothetical protein
MCIHLNNHNYNLQNKDIIYYIYTLFHIHKKGKNHQNAECMKVIFSKKLIADYSFWCVFNAMDLFVV